MKMESFIGLEMSVYGHENDRIYAWAWIWSYKGSHFPIPQPARVSSFHTMVVYGHENSRAWAWK
jgi:hypothetical protein